MILNYPPDVQPQTPQKKRPNPTVAPADLKKIIDFILKIPYLRAPQNLSREEDIGQAKSNTEADHTANRLRLRTPLSNNPPEGGMVG